MANVVVGPKEIDLLMVRLSLAHLMEDLAGLLVSKDVKSKVDGRRLKYPSVLPITVCGVIGLMDRAFIGPSHLIEQLAHVALQVAEFSFGIRDGI